MKITYYCRVCLYLVLLLMVGCSGAREGKMEQNVLRFKTLIDGSDTVKIKGNALWFEHHNYDLPGKWRMEFDEPTFINDQAWKPEWVGGISRPYIDLQPTLPLSLCNKINDTVSF